MLSDLSKNYVIKRADSQDIPRIVQLVNIAYRVERPQAGHRKAPIWMAKGPNAVMIAELMARPASVLLTAADASGAIVGCVYLEEEEGHLHLGTFAVDPSIQARGLGRTMLQYADEYALEHGFDAIYITVVSVRSELIAWYERRGFEATGRRIPFPEHFGAPRMAVDFVEMRRMIG